jgi:hypothetical protein
MIVDSSHASPTKFVQQTTIGSPFDAFRQFSGRLRASV